MSPRKPPILQIPVDRKDRPSRFYKTANVRAENGEFTVSLDGRAAKTPSGAILKTPIRGLAELLAAEWAAQGGHVDFAAMPATRLAFTAIDRTPGVRAKVAAEFARSADADLLCYFADSPRILIDRQERQWGAWLDWAERELGLVFIRAKGLTHQAQPPETLAKVECLAADESDFALSGLSFAAGLYGSVVLAFAVRLGALSGDAAFDLSRLDEAFQEEQWGIDEDAAARTAGLRADARMIGAWFEALRT